HQPRDALPGGAAFELLEDLTRVATAAMGVEHEHPLDLAVGVAGRSPAPPAAHRDRDVVDVAQEEDPVRVHEVVGRDRGHVADRAGVAPNVLGLHQLGQLHRVWVVVPDDAQLESQRYCPVFATVSIDRPGSLRPLPVTRVRMKTIRSPFLPEMRAQSSGLVVLGRSSFSLNSSTQAWSMCWTRRPRWSWSRRSLMAIFLARSTMFWIIAPELKSLK